MFGMEKFNPEQSIGFLIYDVSRLMRRDFDARVASLGLTQAQWRAIAHLARLEGCNQVTLAEQLEVKPMTLARLIDRLVEAGLVGRRPDPQDRRAVQLFLTQQARPVIESMVEKSFATRERALQDVGEDEYETFLSVLRRIKGNLMSSKKAPNPK